MKMNFTDFTPIKDAVLALTADELKWHGFIDKARHGYICPNPDCRDGSGDDGTGMTYYAESKTFYCGKCGRVYDAINVCAFHYGLDCQADFHEVLKRAVDDFNLPFDVNNMQSKSARKIRSLAQRLTPKEMEALRPTPPPDDGKKWQPKVDENGLTATENQIVQRMIYADTQISDYPLEDLLKREKLGGFWRGLPLEQLLKFGCRYIVDWLSPGTRYKHPNMPARYTTPRIIIPADTTPEKANYLARLVIPPDVDEKEYLEQTNARRGKNPIIPKQNAGTKTLFNPAALNSDSPVFCVEGQIDAMSIDYAGYPAVAVQGAKLFGKTLMPELQGREKLPKIIILFDGDDTGREESQNLYDALIKLGCPAVIRFLFDENTKLDCNNILVNDGLDALKEKLAAIVEETAEEFKSVEEKICTGVLPVQDVTRDARAARSLTFEQRIALYGEGATDADFADRINYFFGDEIKFLHLDGDWLIFKRNEFGGSVWQNCGEKKHAIYPFARRLAEMLEDNITPIPHEIDGFEVTTTQGKKGVKYGLKPKTQEVGGVKVTDLAAHKPALEKLGKIVAEHEYQQMLGDQMRNQRRISAAVELLKGVESIRITAEDLNRHSNLLNCLNGVVDLETGKLYTNTAGFLITQQCRAAYDEKSRSDLVDNFFKSIQPDAETRQGLLRWLGYCLTGEVNEEKFMVWTGGGGNGKGVLSGVLLYLLDSYGAGLAPTALLKSNAPYDADKPTASLNALELARFAISEEMPADGELDISRLKNLTGGDEIPLRRLHAESRKITPTAKINISGNYTPKVENSRDRGLLRRMLNMPFLVTFGTPENPADYTLKKKFLLPENLQALLALLVREAHPLYRGEHLIVSPIMQQETQRQLDANDFIGDFISENYERGENLEVKAKVFIDALKREYPRECGRFKRNDLIKLIADTPGITYVKNRTNNRVFKGIGAIDAPTQQTFGDDFDGEPVKPEDVPFEN